jgi:hypothetical protein
MAVAFHSAARLSGAGGVDPELLPEPLPLLQPQEKIASKTGTATKTEKSRLEVMSRSFHGLGGANGFFKLTALASE